MSFARAVGGVERNTRTYARDDDDSRLKGKYRSGVYTHTHTHTRDVLF